MVPLLLWSGTERIDALAGLLEGEPVRVPAHFDAEVFSVVRRMLHRGAIAANLAERALLQTARFHAERVPLAALLAEAYALRDRFSAYDAFYAVLARRTGGLLVTSDGGLARAADGYAEVRLV